MAAQTLNRRDWLRYTAAGSVGASCFNWLPRLVAVPAEGRRAKSCILLWMTGGPSQTDTFDMKPGHQNGGEFSPIKTAVEGVSICEHLPGVAKVMDSLTVIRSMSTKEGDHTRATYLARTGYLPQGPISYPTLGSLLGKELMDENLPLPPYVSIGPYTFLSPAAFGPGFLGPRFAPLIVGNQGLPGQQGAYTDESFKVRNLESAGGITAEQSRDRLDLLAGLEKDFASSRPGVSANSHQAAYDKAVQMMTSDRVKAFQLDEEDPKLRDAYGRNYFGQGCLLARRLVERGVPFVDVSLNGVSGQQIFGWDTHQNNFASLKLLCGVLDTGWSALITDLKDRGLLEDTLVIWMGEFGRTPNINNGRGRDHFPAAWSVVLGGAGIAGGRVYGETTDDGMKVKDKPVNMSEFIATVATAVGIDPRLQNMSNVGRPIRIADPEAQPIREVLK